MLGVAVDPDLLTYYYLRMKKDCPCLAYCPRLALELGSRVDGEARGWAWKPYGWFDPDPRPGDIAHTHFYRRRLRVCLAHPKRAKSEVRLCGESLLPSPTLAWLMFLS